MRRNLYIPPHVREDRAANRHARPAKAEKTDTLLDHATVSDQRMRVLYGTGDLQLCAWVYWDGDRPTIYAEEKPNTEKVTVAFARMTRSLWTFLEKDFLDESMEAGEKMISYNFSAMHMIVLRWMLKEWSLPIPLERLEDGQLTDESYGRVLSVHPHLLDHFVRQYVETLFLPDQEKQRIARQSMLLFSPKGKGVHDACDAISLFCTLAGFWDKFGLNYFDLQKLPQDVFVKLRTVMGFEMEMQQAKAASAAKQPRVTQGRGKGKRVTTPHTRF